MTPRSRIARLALPLAVLAMAATQAVTAAPPDTSDRAITAEVQARLANTRALDRARIRVSTTDGVVKLEGTVRDDKQRTMAMELARSVRGVSAVSDELRAGTD